MMMHDIKPILKRLNGTEIVSEYSEKRISDLCDQIRKLRHELYPNIWANDNYPVDSVLITTMLENMLENYQNVRGDR